MHTLNTQHESGKKKLMKKRQENEQSTEFAHIIEFHFHAFISSKYVLQACCQKGKLLIHRDDFLDIIIGRM